MGYSMARYVEPDLDLFGITSSEGRMIHDFKILGAFMVAYWVPYGYMFRAHHRSFLTHFPLVSTSIRMLYMAPPIFWFLSKFGIWEWWMVPFTFGVWVGLSINDALHWSADTFVGEPEIQKEFDSFRERVNNLWE